MRERTNTWSPLRIAVLIAGILGTAFWLGCLIHWWNIPDERRDGLELIGVFLATAYFAGLVIPTLVLGVIGRWPVVAAIFAALTAALASDTLFPWIPWDWRPG
jgi:hypothetical protein